MLDLISAEVSAGIPPSRIAIAGFSQGGAVALFTGLQYSHPLAGVLCLSGYLAGEESFKLAPEAVNTPVGHFHGTDDPTVRAAQAVSSGKDLFCVWHTRRALPRRG
jgi:predicted esterase